MVVMADISSLPRNEATFVLLIAMVAAALVALFLNGKAKTIVKREGKKPGDLSFIFTSSGQIAAFVGVFLVIIFAYLMLRLA